MGSIVLPFDAFQGLGFAAPFCGLRLRFANRGMGTVLLRALRGAFGGLGFRDGGFPKLGVPTVTENQMEKKMENEMKIVIIVGITWEYLLHGPPRFGKRSKLCASEAFPRTFKG